MKRRWLTGILLAFGLSLAIIAALLFLMRESPRTVYVVRAKTANFPVMVVGFGQTGARRLVLSFSRGGRVAAVLVRSGDRVEEGQLLARLEDAELRKRVELARSRLELARLSAKQSSARLNDQIATLESALKTAEKELTIKRKLLEAGAVSAAEVERAKQRLEQLQRQLESARRNLESDRISRQAQIEARERELEAAQKAMEDARLVAPATGVVETVTLEPGRSADGMIVIRQPGPAVLEARFSVADGSRLRAGQEALLEFEVWPPLELETTVAQVLPQEPGTEWISAQFAEVAGVPENDAQFKALVTVEILPRAVVVPKLAIVEKEGRNFVWTVRHGRARLVEIRIIAKNPEEVAVTGLRTGTVVLSRPPSDLEEGERLRTIEDTDE